MSVYNPARNILARRNKSQQVDQDLVDANMSSTSAALDVSTHKVCAKCGKPTVPSFLANGDPVAFCADCAVAVPVPTVG